MTSQALAPPDEREAGGLHVVFRVGDAEYALAANTVLQMEAYTGATLVPGAAAYVAGIVQLRGRVVPVVDLRARFGLPGRDPTADSRVVVGELGDRIVALVADSAREVVAIPGDRIKPPPRLTVDGSRGFIRAVAQVGDRTLMIVDFAKIIGEEPLDV